MTSPKPLEILKCKHIERGNKSISNYVEKIMKKIIIFHGKHKSEPAVHVLLQVIL